MNIDELVNSIQENELRNQLTQWVNEWKSDDSDVLLLSEIILKWHGNVWFKDSSESNEFLNQFNAFKLNAITGLGGLTLNERLYFFGLFEQWDSANETEQNKLRRKLQANA